MKRTLSWLVLGVLTAGCSGEESATPGETSSSGGTSTSSAGQAGSTGANGGTSSGGAAGQGGVGASGGGNAGVAQGGSGGSTAAGAGGQPGGAGGEGGAGSSEGGQGGAGTAGAGGSGGGEAGGGQGGAGQAGESGAAGAGGYVEPPDGPGTWRSALYPKGWKPLHEGGKADKEGRFLHDFSHAGYHRGEEAPPHGKGAVVSEVDASKGDGKADATGAIQEAIDEACAKGGGVVRLPPGLYRVKLPSASAFAAITLGCSKLVLRGDGPTQSQILLDDPERLRNKAGIAIRPASGSIWDGNNTATHALSKGAPVGTRVVEVGDTGGLTPGDWVAIRNEITDDFREKHRMDKAQNGDSSDWWTSGSFQGLVYPRRIVKIEGATIELDAPTRYELRPQDGARLYRLDRKSVV